jgi:hypothetical protein
MAHQRYFDTCLAPHWPQVQAYIDRDIASRAQTMAHGGILAVLSTLGPGVRWCSPVLELPYLFERDIYLDGRGLLLQPIFFDYITTTTITVTTLIDQSLPVVLTYCTGNHLDWGAVPATATSMSRDPLAALLSRTRARVLRAIIDSAGTTSELARRTTIPLATVSRQASILRDARLITSHRHHNTVVHAATPLGTSLCKDRRQS